MRPRLIPVVFMLICAAMALAQDPTKPPRHGKADPSSGAADSRSQTAPARGTPPSALSLYAGDWTSKSQMYDTDLSKAQEISAKVTCWWTRDVKFLVCDQLITTTGGKHSQLTVYSYDSDQNTYVYSTFNFPGSQPNNGKLDAGDHRFIFSGSSTQGGRRTLFRTTNTFSPSGDRYTVLAEFSTDDGAHWTKMMDGTTTRVQR